MQSYTTLYFIRLY